MAKIEMPSSSINSTGESPKKQLKKVTTGKVTIKQESEIQKLAHNFLAEDLQTIREKLWTDYILPGIKNMVCSAVNIALFGVDRSRGNNGGYFSSATATAAITQMQIRTAPSRTTIVRTVWTGRTSRLTAMPMPMMF